MHLSASAEPDIVFIAPTNHAMPLADFKNNELAAGILKDVGDAIAQRLGRHARFLSVPSKRIPAVLSSGAADGLCYVLPEWIDGTYHWSRPFIPNGGIIAARGDAPVVHNLAELADIPVGTVLGYRYPDMEHALGPHFMREDAPSMDNVLRKLAAGRTRYAVVEEITFAYRLHETPSLGLRADVQYASFEAQCAFSPKTRIPITELDQAIDSLIDDRSMARILQKYR
jgi:ABC-type amino acid transport substrate-binding protein